VEQWLGVRLMLSNERPYSGHVNFKRGWDTNCLFLLTVCIVCLQGNSGTVALN